MDTKENIEIRFRKHVKIMTVLFWIQAVYSLINCLANDRTQLLHIFMLFGVTGAIILAAFPERRNWARRFVILCGCYSLYTVFELLKTAFLASSLPHIAMRQLLGLWAITAAGLVLNGYWIFLSWLLLQPNFRSLFTSKPHRLAVRIFLYGAIAFLAVLGLSPLSEKLRTTNKRLEARNAVNFHTKAEKKVGFPLPFWGQASVELSRPDLSVVTFYAKSPSQTLASAFWLFATPGDKEMSLDQLLKELHWSEKGNRSTLFAPLGHFQSDLDFKPINPISVPLSQGTTKATWVSFPQTGTHGVFFQWRNRERSFTVVGVNVAQADGNQFIAELVNKNSSH